MTKHNQKLLKLTKILGCEPHPKQLEEITRLAKELKAHEKALDDLAIKIRTAIGFEKTDVSYYDFGSDICSNHHEKNEDAVIEFALRTIIRWDINGNQEKQDFLEYIGEE